jgi:hypothetical protein
MVFDAHDRAFALFMLNVPNPSLYEFPLGGGASLIVARLSCSSIRASRATVRQPLDLLLYLLVDTGEFALNGC